MNRKVGIVTIEGNKNYGNKLQNYALQEILQRKGYEPYTIWQKRYISRKIKTHIKKIIYMFLSPKNIYLKKCKREKIFSKFTKEYLKIKYIKRKDLLKLDNDFDCYVIGSDQVWNPDIINTYLGLEILNNKKNKIAYAPSIAQKNVSDRYKKLLKDNITYDKIKHVSLREETGKKLVEEITKRKDIVCVLDPTLMLEKSEWESLIKKPSYIENNKFVLCYFLGDLSKNRKKLIAKYAEENNCSVINILDSNSCAYYSSIGEFLYLEKNAYTIFTDSFHSSVFGLIFNTPFYVFERDDKVKDMSSRLNDFLKKFNLEQQLINESDFYKINNCIDYSKSNNILNVERKKSNKFIEMALKDEEN